MDDDPKNPDKPVGDKTDATQGTGNQSANNSSSADSSANVAQNQTQRDTATDKSQSTTGQSVDKSGMNQQGSAGQASQQTSATKRTVSNRRSGSEFYDTMVQAKAWYGDLDHSNGMRLRKCTIPPDSSQQNKAKRARKTKPPTVEDAKNGDGSGSPPDTKNGDGATRQP